MRLDDDGRAETLGSVKRGQIKRREDSYHTFEQSNRGEGNIGAQSYFLFALISTSLLYQNQYSCELLTVLPLLPFTQLPRQLPAVPL